MKKRLLRYIIPYRFHIVLSLLTALVSALLSLYIPLLTGRTVDLILGPGKVDFSGVIKMIISIAVLALVSSLSQWVMNVLNNRISFGVVRDMRNAAFEKISRLPLKYLDSHSSGELLSRVISDAEQLSDGLLMGSAQIFTGVVTILGTLGLMLMIDLQIGLLVVCLTPLSLFVAKFIAGRTYNYALRQAEVRGRETGFVNEMIGGEKVIHAFNREEECLKDFDALNSELEKASLKATFFSSLTNPSTRFVNNSIYALVAVAGAFSCVRGLMSVGQLTSFLSFAGQYTRPFNEISGVVTELQGALASAERLISLIDEEEESPDKIDAVQPASFEGRIDIEDLSFSYVPEKKLIQDFDLSVSPGQHIAIVGPTGCGKTTLINLLMRFYDPLQGVIRVDGRDIREIKRGSLRDAYGMVLQETWLKNGTIRENLKFGAPEATDEEMINAAKTCHAHSFIKRLPDGYDSVINEGGEGLSAGQKQLLCITRAMLSRPSMLILDEATSSIDTRTEIKIQTAFQEMMKGKTAFIVAHRLSTVREADIILCMKDGNIVEKGDHEELIRKKGFYYSLYRSQFLGNAI